MKANADKKKMLIVGALVLVIAGVGAFQFLGGGAPAAKSAGKKAAKVVRKTDTDESRKQKLLNDLPPDVAQMISRPLPARDPFAILNPLKEDPKSKKGKQEPNTTPPSDPKNAVPGEPPNRLIGGPATPPEQSKRPTPVRNNPSIPPMDPMVGSLPNVDAGTPNPGADGEKKSNSNGIGMKPGKIARQPGEFAYSLTGVVTGPHPMAVLLSDSGEQRIVRSGSTINEKSKVVSVSNGRVVIEHDGKRITLTLGGAREK